MLPLVHDRHVVEDDLAAGDGVVDLRSDVANERQRDVGEHQAPAVGGAFGIALVDADVVTGIGAPHQVGEEQSRRTAADDANLHACRSRASLNCATLRRIWPWCFATWCTSRSSTTNDAGFTPQRGFLLVASTARSSSLSVAQRLGGSAHRLADVGDDVVELVRGGVRDRRQARGVGVVAAPRLARSAARCAASRRSRTARTPGCDRGCPSPSRRLSPGTQ